ncbi:hypothetical protein [Catenuloplanes atrovinosus]|uniref:Glycosyl transferase n=1 Tax=Catenuloplanes atrovinosus TaxID=137266 RepID=A0AAE3YVG6_9ACTN|nr:hypothetical protein [Catenuloplanes atrovinosus]MDR7279952.1 hypothetical protein [Catenuloplanes atrovinosus]
MTTSSTVPHAAEAGGPDEAAERPPATESTPAGKGPRWTGRRIDMLVTLFYLLGAFWVTIRAWIDPWGRVLGEQAKDQAFNEWMFSYDAHVVRNLDNPFFTTLQNAPDGVNLMGNVAMQLPGILLSPLTMVAGPEVTYLALMTANLFFTALTWYWLLSRHLVKHRFGAFAGALVIGFGPAIISHSNGHPHITSMWLIPFILWRVIRLGEPGRTVRNGLILGALVLAQLFIGEENLFLTAVACVFLVIGYAISDWRDTRARFGRAVGSLAIGGGLVLLAAAYPLYHQFAGPQHYSGHPGDQKPATILSYFAYATESIGGGKNSAAGLAPNFTEEVTFFGWPLMLIAVAGIVWLRREPIVRVVAAVGIGASVLSLGPVLHLHNQRNLKIPGPFALFEHLPVVNAMVVARFNIITTVAMGVLLAVIVARVAERARPAETSGLPVRFLSLTVLAAALIPIMPTPLSGHDRPGVPEFVTAGTWRDYVAEGRTVVPVPVNGLTSIRYGSAADVGFAVPSGYFLGPTSPDDNTGRWGAPPRPTWQLLETIQKSKAGDDPIVIGDAERAAAIEDLRYWKADAVVLPTDNGTDVKLLLALESLLGPGTRVADVWLWDVRPITNN